MTSDTVNLVLDSRLLLQGDGDDENDPEYRIPADAEIGNKLLVESSKRCGFCI